MVDDFISCHLYDVDLLRVLFLITEVKSIMSAAFQADRFVPAVLQAGGGV